MHLGKKMAVQVGIGKFYGRSLPRPRIYEDVKFNAERVDPPTPPSAPLVSWAREVNWTVGGMSSKRKRMQGKIEGSLKKLRDLQDDDDDDNDVGIAPDFETSNRSSVDTQPANEDLATSDEDSDECSLEVSHGVRTRAEKVNEAVSSSSRRALKGGQNNERVNKEVEVLDGLDSVTRKAPPTRGGGGKKKPDCAGVEPVTSRRAASVRRSGRSLVARRNRGQD